MSYLNIAKWILFQPDRDSGDNITHLKLQKMLYYCQAWSLVLQKKPLFEEDFQAWTHWPVLPELFSLLTGHWSDPLDINVLSDDLQEIDSDAQDVLTQVWQSYWIYTAKALEEMTHQEDPRKNARGTLSLEARCTKVITKEEMNSFYSQKYKEANG